MDRKGVEFIGQNLVKKRRVSHAKHSKNQTNPCSIRLLTSLSLVKLVCTRASQSIKGMTRLCVYIHKICDKYADSLCFYTFLMMASCTNKYINLNKRALRITDFSV